jgi:hypothetical protein
MRLIKVGLLSVIFSFIFLLSSCATVKHDVEEGALFKRAIDILSLTKAEDQSKLNLEVRAVYAQLNEKVKSNQFDSEIGRPWSRYLRGMLGMHVLNADLDDAQPVNIKLATLSVEDLDATALEDERVLKAARIPSMEAIYSAARIIYNYLEDKPRSYGYFERCADLGHAGCANVVAYYVQNGIYGQALDLEKAVKYHKKVVQSGTRFWCAGSYSAGSIARMVLLDGVVTPEGDEQSWVQLSISLSKQVSAQMGGKTACNLHETENDAYLYQLTRGMPTVPPGRTHERPDKNSGQVGSWAFGKLILDSMNQAEFDTIVAAEKKTRSRCNSWLNATWLFSMRADEAAKEKYRARIMAEDEKECAAERRHLSKIEALQSRSVQ